MFLSAEALLKGQGSYLLLCRTELSGLLYFCRKKECEAVRGMEMTQSITRRSKAKRLHRTPVGDTTDTSKIFETGRSKSSSAYRLIGA